MIIGNETHVVIRGTDNGGLVLGEISSGKEVEITRADLDPVLAEVSAEVMIAMDFKLREEGGIYTMATLSGRAW